MADIAINPVSRRVQFTGNTGTGPFAFTFNILADEDIVVYKNTTLLTLTTDYTVATNADGTGSVTLVAALVSSDVLTIIGGRELERTTDFVTAGDLLAESLNEQLDSLVIMAQQLDEKMTRSFKVNPGDVFTDLEMPLLDDRKGRFLQFNTTTGDPEAGPSNTSVSNIANYITEIDTVGDDLNAGSFTAGSEYDFGLITDPSVGSTGSPDGFIVTVYNNLADITAVAGISSNVNTVASISANVTTVASNNANITTVAGNISNVNTVAGISSDVTTVAGISSDVTAVVADATDIGTVATNIANVNAVGGISANVTTVAGISSDVTAVAADATDIGTVATNIADINTAASNITEIQNAPTNAATATTKAAEAATSATNAATSETNASTSATNAATSAGNASISAANSASSATSASNAQAAAEAARDSALASFDSFDDRYLGTKTSDPSLDNDGNALVAGALYFNTTSSAMKVYTGSAWVAAYVSGTDYLALSGGEMTGDLKYGDNIKAKFGADDDLQIYHDGSHSYVDENGTGQLKIRSNGTGVLLQTVSGENLATFANNAAVNLYYDNAAKLATTSTGIDVTGQVRGVDRYYFKRASDNYSLSALARWDGSTGSPLTGTAGIHTVVGSEEASGSVILAPSNTERMRIDSSGNVGIGTSSAYSGAKLSVNGSIVQAAGTQYVIGTYGTSGLQLIGQAGSDNIIGTMGASEPLILRTGSSERMRIDSSGKVGINNTSPSYMLDTVAVSSVTPARLAAANNDAQMYLQFNTSTTGQFIGCDSSSTFRVKRGSDSTTMVSIDTSGNLTALGNVTAYSDERLKDNVVTIENALDKVSAIRGVTYNRNDMEDAPRHAGVIAQEVEKVLPEVVQTDDDDIKTVAYGNMVGLLIEAIKELKAEIEELKHGSTK